MLDDTLIIVASDHGEHLGDHLLFSHGCSLYRQLVGVPLVIVDPKRVPAATSGAWRAGELAQHSRNHAVDHLAFLAPPVPGAVACSVLGGGNESVVGTSGEPLLMETSKPLGLTDGDASRWPEGP